MSPQDPQGPALVNMLGGLAARLADEGRFVDAAMVTGGMQAMTTLAARLAAAESPTPPTTEEKGGS